jgi:hypothetical protein
MMRDLPGGARKVKNHHIDRFDQTWGARLT